jgi:hypothetical protein
MGDVRDGLGSGQPDCATTEISGGSVRMTGPTGSNTYSSALIEADADGALSWVRTSSDGSPSYTGAGEAVSGGQGAPVGAGQGGRLGWSLANVVVHDVTPFVRRCWV